VYHSTNHALIHALDDQRRRSFDRSAARSPRAAPDTGAIRRTLGLVLVRLGTRLAPEVAPPASAASVARQPC